MLCSSTARVAWLGALGLLACSGAKPAPGDDTTATGGSGGTDVPADAAPVARAGGAGGGGIAGSGGSPAIDAGAAGRAGSGGSAGRGGAGGSVAAVDASMPVGDPATGDGDFVVGPAYPTQPELTNQNNPHGKSFRFTMDSSASAIFRGDDKTLALANQHPFTRAIDVYVPAQYKDGTPAPVLIIQDGPGELGLVKNALDNLTIAKDPARRLPAFVAVAVQNGGGDGKGSERGLEYDTMSDRYARFIQTEVLPAVAANAQLEAAYPKFAFTDDPDGRATLGCSSGGAAALIMGWFRPEWFHRIVTYSGTFVDQQDDDAPEEKMYPLGAWEFHSGLQLIAKSPIKPLRVFVNANEMDAGYNAPESGHHNWVMANQRTAAALKATGYHYRFVFGRQAGHCQGSVQSATLADSLVWAWRGFPTP